LGGGVYDLAPSTTIRSKVRGQKEPMQGWTSPDFRVFRPRWTVAYSNQGASQTDALTLALDDAALHASSVHVTGGLTTIGLVDADGQRTRLEVEQTGRTLAIRSAD
jgi:hypothetical protein